MDRNRKFSWENFTIANLTTILTFLIALVNLLDIIFDVSNPHFRIQFLLTELWWHIFLFPFRITNNLLYLLLFLYIFWSFGSTLEEELGTKKYNLYIFSGYFFLLLGTYFYPVDAYYVYLSIFFALAYLLPDMEIWLFFFLPVKMKWLGLFFGGLILFNTILASITSGSPAPLLGVLFAFANFFLFILVPHLREISPKPHQIQYRLKQLSGKDETLHRCTICGITEKDDPYMDFRYCVECKDHEYCRNHLYNHEHIKD